MSVLIPNPAPRLAEIISTILPDPKDQFTLVDIGARDGFPTAWSVLRPASRVIGFEAEPTECQRLNDLFQAQGNPTDRVYPYAVAGVTGRVPFHLTRFPASAGLRRANPAWIDRFCFDALDVVETIEIDAVTLDEFRHREKIDRIDFMKLDVEGSEFDVLHGGRECLSAVPNILGVATEVWWDPIAKGQTGFAEIDILLRNHGLRFFDLHLDRYTRATLPMGRLHGQRNAEGGVQITHGDGDFMSYGQAITGDALYFRDPVGEQRGGTLSPDWDAPALLRLCALMDVYDFGDCALEILECFADTLLAGIDVSPLMDALVPMIDNGVVPYGMYRDFSIQYRREYNRAMVNIPNWQAPSSRYRR